jgi:DNA-directed RNA polymerase subunit L
MFHNYIFNANDPSNNHTFDIHDVDLAIVNGIRRIILTDIPIPAAIGEKLDHDEPTVEIIENSGALHNEFIIHRIGLIPICLTEEEIELYEDNSLILELKVRNDTNFPINVTTKDFKAYMNGDEVSVEKLNSIFPPNNVSKDNILITRLRTGESLHLSANIVKRTARDNASFNPVSLSNFSYIQDPKEAVKYDNVIDKERCYYKNKYGDPYKYKFDIEYINVNVGPKYLIAKSLDIIINKLSNISKELINTENSDVIKVQQFQDIESTYEFIIENEDDTIGNIIQSYIHNKYVREKSKFKNNIVCSYAGYICPHPLKSIMIIRITLENIIEEETFKLFLDGICKDITEEIINIKTNWNKFVIENNVS